MWWVDGWSNSSSRSTERARERQSGDQSSGCWAQRNAQARRGTAAAACFGVTLTPGQRQTSAQKRGGGAGQSRAADCSEGVTTKEPTGSPPGALGRGTYSAAMPAQQGSPPRAQSTSAKEGGVLYRLES